MDKSTKPDAGVPSAWTYGQAFSRNLGIVSPAEQQTLRETRVAIAGMGGVGGIHLVTLARLGIGRFTIADFDVFDTANFNRQYGATVSNLRQPKTDVMERVARDINPEIELTILREPINAENVDRFLAGVDLLVDGIDAFEILVRRLLFRKARERGLFGITAGPLGLSTAWLIFDPNAMSFDEYFDFRDGSDDVSQFSDFLIGLAPSATHVKYTDLSFIDPKTRRGPSAAAGCHLASGVVGAQALKILLKRPGIKAAPHYNQFDAYLGVYRHGRLLFGNRHPLQRLKRRLLARQIRSSLQRP